jgi:hypothetical protein
VPDTVFGLPSHALVLHAAVTLVPLAALAVIAIALVPRWRAAFGVPVAALTVLTVIAVFVVTETGEQLRDRMGYDPASFEHGDIADGSTWWVLPMCLLAIALAVMARRDRDAGGGDGRTRAVRTRARQGVAGLVVAALAVASSGVATYQIIRAGHSGAESVWQGRVPPGR